MPGGIPSPVDRTGAVPLKFGVVGEGEGDLTKWSKFGLFGVGIAVSIGLAVQLGNWWRGGEEGAAVVLLPDDSALVADGRKLYDQACASCHGAMLEGQPNWRQRKADGRLPAPPHDPSGHTWHHPDAVLLI